MSDVVQEIKDRLDIVEVIRSYIQLLPAGKNFKANCPFHKEKTPSFMVSPDRRSWHCFGGCNEGGDLISFVMKYENIEFYDALKTLAERAGIDPSRLRGSTSEYKKYDALYAINEWAKYFFKKQLTPEARAYYGERGLAQATIEEFELGYAPAASDALLRELIKQGFSVNDIEQAGVVFRTDRGTYWDRFRGRLMFPLYNHVGKVVGFTGRIIPNLTSSQDVTIAKYVNSPETPIFSKSKIVYGFHKAKSHIREQNAAVLVEGQMDFLMAYQSGVRHVVASSGTALTHEHLKTVRRLADRVVLCFDSDEAGQKAIERSIDLALAQDFNVSVVRLPDKDPADIVKHTPGRLQELLAAACPVREFYFERYVPPASVSGEAYTRGIRAILAKVKTIGSPLEQSAWIKALSGKLGVGEHTLVLEMEHLVGMTGVGGVSKAVQNNAQESVTKNCGRKELIARRIIELGGAPELHTYAPEYAGAAVSDATALHAAWEGSAAPSDNREQELWALILQLKREFYKERCAALKAVIVQAQAEGNEAQLTIALREFDKYSRELHTSRDEKTAEKSPQARHSSSSAQEGIA